MILSKNNIVDARQTGTSSLNNLQTHKDIYDNAMRNSMPVVESDFNLKRKKF